MLKRLKTCVQDAIQCEQTNDHLVRRIFSHLNRNEVPLSETIEDYDFSDISEISGVDSNISATE